MNVENCFDYNFCVHRIIYYYTLSTIWSKARYTQIVLAESCPILRFYIWLQQSSFIFSFFHTISKMYSSNLVSYSFIRATFFNNDKHKVESAHYSIFNS